MMVTKNVNMNVLVLLEAIVAKAIQMMVQNFDVKEFATKKVNVVQVVTDNHTRFVRLGVVQTSTPRVQLYAEQPKIVLRVVLVLAIVTE